MDALVEEDVGTSTENLASMPLPTKQRSFKAPIEAAGRLEREYITV